MVLWCNRSLPVGCLFPGLGTLCKKTNSKDDFFGAVCQLTMVQEERSLLEHVPQRLNKDPRIGSWRGSCDGRTGNLEHSTTVSV
jgi:hypothetical protein